MSTLFQSTGVKIVLTVLILAAVVAIVSMLMRRIRHWYWKTDKIVDAVNEVGRDVRDLEHEVIEVKGNTNILMEKLEDTHLSLTALQERLTKLIEVQEQISANAQASLTFQEGSEAYAIAGYSEEEEDILKQYGDLEKAITTLKKQKEDLEADINARIRD